MTWSNVRLWKLRCDAHGCQTVWVSTDDQRAQDALENALADGWEGRQARHLCPEHAAQQQEESAA